VSYECLRFPQQAGRGILAQYGLYSVGYVTGQAQTQQGKADHSAFFPCCISIQPCSKGRAWSNTRGLIKAILGHLGRGYAGPCTRASENPNLLRGW
jgi:hypothetical protein